MDIAYDASSIGVDGSGTSLTFAHTCTGSNLILWVSCITGGGDNITGITYNGVAMTQLSKTAIVGGGTFLYLYYLAGPATGAHNVVISAGSSVAIYGRATSYTGASQTGIPDASVINTTTSASAITTTVTVVTANSWLVGSYGNDSGAFTAGANTTIRQQANSVAIADSNGAQAAGSRSMTFTLPSSNVAGLMASFAPATEAGGMLLFF